MKASFSTAYSPCKGSDVSICKARFTEHSSNFFVTLHYLDASSCTVTVCNVVVFIACHIFLHFSKTKRSFITLCCLTNLMWYGQTKAITHVSQHTAYIHTTPTMYRLSKTKVILTVSTTCTSNKLPKLWWDQCQPCGSLLHFFLVTFSICCWHICKYSWCCSIPSFLLWSACWQQQLTCPGTTMLKH